MQENESLRTCIESYPDAVRHRCRLERPPEGPGPRRRRYHFLETSQEKDASGYKDKREERFGQERLLKNPLWFGTSEARR